VRPGDVPGKAARRLGVGEQAGGQRGQMAGQRRQKSNGNKRQAGVETQETRKQRCQRGAPATRQPNGRARSPPSTARPSATTCVRVSTTVKPPHSLVCLERTAKTQNVHTRRSSRPPAPPPRRRGDPRARPPESHCASPTRRCGCPTPPARRPSPKAPHGRRRPPLAGGGWRATRRRRGGGHAATRHTV